MCWSKAKTAAAVTLFERACSSTPKQADAGASKWTAEWKAALIGTNFTTHCVSFVHCTNPTRKIRSSLVSLVSGLSSPLRPHHTLTPHQVLEREMPNLHFNRLSGTISDALSGAKLGASPLLECNALSGSVPLAWLGQAEHHPRMGLDLAAGSGQCGEFSNVVEPHLALAARYTSRKCGTSTCPPT